MLPTGRRLAIDYGDVRVGVAISDAAGILATPYKTFPQDIALGSLPAVVEQENVVVIYVGLPLHLSGQPGESAHKAQSFAQQLKMQISSDVMIRLIDERLSSKSAQEKALIAGKKVGRDSIDQLAAVEILESALMFEKSNSALAGKAIPSE